MPAISKNIFRAYDIRGVYPSEINESVSEWIGKAFGTYLMNNGKKNCVVGRDNRSSSPSISKAFIDGLLSTGCKVTDTGLVITPNIHFLTFTHDFDAGIIISASHNPKEYNGIKLELKYGVPFADGDLTNLADMISLGGFVGGSGELVDEDLSIDYSDYFAGHFAFSPLKVVVLCGHGAAGGIVPDVLERLGCEVTREECDMLEDFPSGIPNPEDPEYMGRLQKLVLKHKADVGFAFDTDGDRLGVCDEKGIFYANDRILLLFAEDVLKSFPGATIVYDVKSSGVVEEVIAELGGVPKMVKTGRTYYRQELDSGAVLGSELSGHTYFDGDYFGFDDGLYAACRVLKVMDESKKPLSELMSKYPIRFSTPEVKVPCADEIKFEVIKRIEELVIGSGSYENIILIDGVRAYSSKTGWFLIRVSNTTPYLSIRAEGKDKKELIKQQKLVEGVLEKVLPH
jgi:phosphomannomutase/phosphoglucomutase